VIKMNAVDVEIIDNSSLVREELESAVLRALTKCGLTAEGYAKMLCTVDTGLLRNSITYALSGQPPAIFSYTADRADKSGKKKKGTYSGTAPNASGNEMSVYIGSNVSYSSFVECGTGQHYVGGRPTRWTYADEHGNQHITGGNVAQPFLKPAIADHIEEYKNIIKQELTGG